jgi:hypothetical protein
VDVIKSFLKGSQAPKFNPKQWMQGYRGDAGTHYGQLYGPWGALSSAMPDSVSYNASQYFDPNKTIANYMRSMVK